MEASRQTWLKPLRFLARAIKYVILLWLWWIGLASLAPDSQDARDEWSWWNLLVYLALSIALGGALFALSRM